VKAYTDRKIGTMKFLLISTLTDKKMRLNITCTISRKQEWKEISSIPRKFMVCDIHPSTHPRKPPFPAPTLPETSISDKKAVACCFRRAATEREGGGTTRHRPRWRAAGRGARWERRLGFLLLGRSVLYPDVKIWMAEMILIGDPTAKTRNVVTP
jgi:hypothetical protein